MYNDLLKAKRDLEALLSISEESFIKSITQDGKRAIETVETGLLLSLIKESAEKQATIERVIKECIKREEEE